MGTFKNSYFAGWTPTCKNEFLELNFLYFYYMQKWLHEKQLQVTR